MLTFKIVLILVAAYSTGPGTPIGGIVNREWTAPMPGSPDYATAAACRADLRDHKLWAAAATRVLNYADAVIPEGAATVRLAVNVRCERSAAE